MCHAPPDVAPHIVQHLARNSGPGHHYTFGDKDHVVGDHVLQGRLDGATSRAPHCSQDLVRAVDEGILVEQLVAQPPRHAAGKGRP